MTKLRLPVVALLAILSTEPAVSKTVGIMGITSEDNEMEALTDLLEGAGHTVIDRGAGLSFGGLDVVMLLDNTFGEAETTFQGLKNFGQGGGLLITEWTGAAQALNAASLLDAEDRGLFTVGTTSSNPLSSITFTHRSCSGCGRRWED